MCHTKFCHRLGADFGEFNLLLGGGDKFQGRGAQRQDLLVFIIEIHDGQYLNPSDSGGKLKFYNYMLREYPYLFKKAKEFKWHGSRLGAKKFSIEELSKLMDARERDSYYAVIDQREKIKSLQSLKPEEKVYENNLDNY